MSRSTSATFRQAVFAQETGEAFLLLLTIQHADIGTPDTLYFVNNRENITSNEQVYTAYRFKINLPNDEEDRLSQIQLLIDNVDRSIVEAIRSLTGEPTVNLYVILADSPDTIEAGPFEMTMRSAEWDYFIVNASIQPEDILNEPYPGDAYTPENFPGLF